MKSTLFKAPSQSFIILLLLLASFNFAQGQNQSPIGRESISTITTAVPILTVARDARSAALGDAGVAITPDANAAYWNPAKLGFVTDDFSIGLSYSPWLRNIINDMSLSYLSGYKKVSQRSAFAASLLYFDLGEIQFTDDQGRELNNFNPKEYAFDVSYGQQLSENFGLGISARFIHSNLSAGISDSRPGNSAAVDIGAYYTKDLNLGAREYNLSFGANLSNLGAKIAYTDANRKDFLPTNLRLGTALTMHLDPYNKFTLAIDGNKLLVPSVNDSENISVPRALFSSFGDAPNGFKEEMQEVALSTGLEYWYNDVFAARTGYFYESPNKGDRHYLSLGIGMRYQKFGLDVAYLVPNSRNNPLAQTARFTLFLKINQDEE